MTTIIATRDGVYTDSRVTAGIKRCTPFDGGPKAVRIAPDCILALAGSPVDFGVVWSWWESDRKSWPVPGESNHEEISVVGSVCAPDWVQTFEAPGVVHRQMQLGDDQPFAVFGSGEWLAVGAMLAGAGPWEALRIAAAVDGGTEGPFYFVPFGHGDVERKI